MFRRAWKQIGSVTVATLSGVTLLLGANLWYNDPPEVHEHRRLGLQRSGACDPRYVQVSLLAEEKSTLCYEEFGSGERLVFVFCSLWPLLVAEKGLDRINSALSARNLRLVVVDTPSSHRGSLWRDMRALSDWPLAVRQLYAHLCPPAAAAEGEDAALQIVSCGEAEAWYAIACAAGSAGLPLSRVHIFGRSPPQPPAERPWPQRLYQRCEMEVFLRLYRLAAFKSQEQLLGTFGALWSSSDAQLIKKHQALVVARVQDNLLDGVEPLLNESLLLAGASPQDLDASAWRGQFLRWCPGSSAPFTTVAPVDNPSFHQSASESIGPLLSLIHI